MLDSIKGLALLRGSSEGASTVFSIYAYSASGFSALRASTQGSLDTVPRGGYQKRREVTRSVALQLCNHITWSSFLCLQPYYWSSLFPIDAATTISLADLRGVARRKRRVTDERPDVA